MMTICVFLLIMCVSYAVEDMCYRINISCDMSKSLETQRSLGENRSHTHTNKTTLTDTYEVTNTSLVKVSQVESWRFRIKRRVLAER